jgi:hypothetical protein
MVKKIMRKLLDNAYSFLPRLYQGSQVEEFNEAVDLTIHTKAPGKWLLIDLETGQEYIGSDVPTKYGRWRRIKDRHPSINKKDML